MAGSAPAAVDLYWIPLGAGTPVVQASGRVSSDLEVAARVVDLLPTVPTPVWGRDQAGTGDMWNSNSIMSWVLTRSGVDTDRVRPPAGGRAPGWDAGRIVARRDTTPHDVVHPYP